MKSSISTTQTKFITTLLLSSTSFYLWWISKDRIRQIWNCYFERRSLRLLALQHEKEDRKEEGGGEEDGKMYVSGLFIYPVKSLQAVSLSSTKVTSFGFENDRQIMIVRPIPSRPYSSSSYDVNAATHRFVTQRQCPILATISTSLIKQNETIILSLSCDGETTLKIDVSPKTISKYTKIRAAVWDDVVTVLDLGDDIATYISNIMMRDALASKEDLKSFQNVRVVSMLKNDNGASNTIHSRPVPASYLPPSALYKWNAQVPDTTLNDGFPILVTSEASLDDVNARLIKRGKETILMNRFRPNLVIKGGLNMKPFEEDTWKAIQINNVLLYVAKGCPRCKQSCTDQRTGERFEEPLDTLSTFRKMNERSGDDVYFGQNVVFVGLVDEGKDDGNVICVGDEVKVLTRGEAVWDREDVQAE